MNRLFQLQSELISGGGLDAHELKSILFGKHYKFREDAWKTVSANKVFNDHYHLNDYTLDQIRNKTVKKLAVAYRHTPDLQGAQRMDEEALNKIILYCNGLTFSDMNFCILGGVHSFLYLRAIYQLGTQKHRQLFLRAVNFKQIGCFGLTQLYHGSNVKGILTEAVYDHQNKEFIINTPKKEAMKFWIGGAAKTATKSVIWAQLYIDGKNYGVHAFVVPLRDPQTYKLLPGVLIGDCGPKAGLNGVDNGFIFFDNVRISKDYILDKISGVDENGKFRTKIENDQKRFGLHLGALSGGRFFIATNCSALSLQALTIALRYADERRQFKGSKDTEEKKLIEYPMMKRRLMPLLATNLVYYRASMHYIILSNRTLDNFMDLSNPLVEQLHAISSVMKAKSSWYSSECIQQCRQAMGGHGYSTASKIGTLYNDNDINSTWEGDNYVLIQQTSKYVLQQAQKVLQKGMTSNNPLLLFLNSPPENLPEITRQNLLCFQKGLEFLQFKLMRKIEETGMRMLQLKNNKLPLMDIWNNSQVFLGREVAIIYGDIALLTIMKEGITQAKNAENKKLLETATKLWLLTLYRSDEFIQMTHHSFIESLIGQQCQKLAKYSYELLKLISPDDSVTGSPFSDANGRGIEKYLQFIQSKPTNKRVEWWQMLLER